MNPPRRPHATLPRRPRAALRQRRYRYRYWHWLAVVALVTGLAACTADGGDDPPPSTPPAGPTTAAPSPLAEPPDGAELAVVETGFSASPNPTGDPEADLLSWGVMLENTSDEYAVFDGVVTVRLLDADGDPIDELSGEPSDEPVQFLPVVTRVLPGERVGFGNTVPHYGADVAAVAVEVETGYWQPVTGGAWWTQPITASAVTTQDTSDGSTLSFTVDAAFTEDMIPGELRIGGHFAAIFRDSGGAVIGGAKCCHGTGEAAVEVPPGQSQGELNLRDGIPADADDARTEVYLPDPQENLPR
jgi:hypothetical protein